MKSEKRSAVASGNSAGAPTAAKLGWITMRVPTKPTAQAARRWGPTSSPSTNRPSRSRMKGMTKTIATASASGR